MDIIDFGLSELFTQTTIFKSYIISNLKKRMINSCFENLFRIMPSIFYNVNGMLNIIYF